MKTFLKSTRLFSLVVLFLSSHFLLNTGEQVAFALSVKPLTLQQLTSMAARIVDVTLIDKQVADDTGDSGFQVTYYTFQVHEWLKGSGNNQLVIKQATPENGEGLGGRNRFGLPDYKLNQRYYLFLAGDSGKGLTSPLGVTQGVFRVDEVDGVPTIRGLSARKSLVGNLSSQLPRRALTNSELSIESGNESATDFRSIVKKILEK